MADRIAIIGIGCRFPGGDGPEAFWRLLRDGVDAVGEVPADRWDVDDYYDPDPSAPGTLNTRRSGFLEQVDRFDADFFGISPREAVRMDPQQRLLLEVAWEALEDAGQVPERLAGSRTGVFIGIATNDYGRLQWTRADASDAYIITGNAASIAANRLSYLYDFRGPSLAVDTACSSSLVAVHLACQSLRSGECDAGAGRRRERDARAGDRGQLYQGGGSSPPTAGARHSTPAPTATSAARVPASSCSSRCRARWPTAIGSTP